MTANLDPTTNTRYQTLLFAHGALVLGIGLICGIVLIFSMLKGFVLWPILDIPYELPGSVRGWKAAHIGGICNGLLLIAIGVVLAKIPMSSGSSKFVFWSFIATAWGNTVFYWAGNFAANRGISAQSNAYGESDLSGVIAFVAGGSVMLFTIIATLLIALAAFRHARTL